MSIEEPKAAANEDSQPRMPAPRRSTYRYAAASALIATALIVGVGAGAVGMNVLHPRDQQTLLPPVAISAMADDSVVAIKGQVAEVFGNKFIISDPSGRALVDLGRSGEGTELVKQGEEVTAQGRFDNGFVSASMLAHADGKVDELRALPPPPHEHGPKGPPRPGDLGPGAGPADIGAPRP